MNYLFYRSHCVGSSPKLSKCLRWLPRLRTLRERNRTGVEHLWQGSDTILDTSSSLSPAIGKSYVDAIFRQFQEF